MKNARTAPRLVLRLPLELKQWLERQAEENHRPVSGEAIVAIEHYKRHVEAQVQEKPAA